MSLGVRSPFDLSPLDEAVLTAQTYEQVMEGVSEVIAPLLSASMCGIMIWEPAQDALQMVPGSFGAPDVTIASYRVSGSDLGSNAGRVFCSGIPHVSNCATSDPEILQDYVEAFGVERLITLPLGLRDRRTGVLHIANRDEPFDDADVAIAIRSAPRVAVAVEYVRNVMLIRRKEALGGVLARVAEAIASGGTLHRIISEALDGIVYITGASLALLSVRGHEAAAVRNGRVESAVERVFRAESHRGSRLRQERVARPRRAGDPGWAALHVPVTVAEERLGTLSLLRTRAEPLSPDERAALTRLADLTALAWATERYQQERAVMARLRERERIADDLHDHVAQILFSSKISLELALEHSELRGHQRESVVRARDLLSQGEEAIREVIDALAQPACGDLEERIRNVVQEVEERFDIAVHLEMPHAGLPAPVSDRSIADLVVRACREGLVNAAKHALPSRVAVSLRLARSDRLLLAVQDDGVGLPTVPNRAGHGLKALRRAVQDHGGALRVHRDPAGGTRLTVGVPYRR